MADLRKEVANLKESDRDRKEDKLKQEIADLKSQLSSDFNGAGHSSNGLMNLTGERTDGAYDSKCQFSQERAKMCRGSEKGHS